jgi:sialic acid synthase SpsE
MKKTLTISNKVVGDSQPVFIIAEAGVNHNKNVELAKKLVDIAKEAGADAVKFQTWDVDALYVADEISGGDYRAASRKRCLSYDDYREIKKYCDEVGIIFISTPDEEASADFLESLGVPAFKIGSGELANTPLIEHVAKKGRPVILSTGMGEEKHIAKAVDAVRKYNDQLVLLHCVSSYPTPPEDAGVPRVSELRQTYDVLSGYSDHTVGNTAAVLSVAEGAVVIEKHFTFDKAASGPDHRMSLDPIELKGFVRAIRDAEAMRKVAPRGLAKGEVSTKNFAWKSAVARVAIKKGDTLSLSNVVFKRPGKGITVDKWEELQGKKVIQDVKEGNFITERDIV